MKNLLKLSKKSIIIISSVIVSIVALVITLLVVINGSGDKNQVSCMVYFDSRGGTEITTSEVVCGTALTISTIICGRFFINATNN